MRFSPRRSDMTNSSYYPLSSVRTNEYNKLLYLTEAKDTDCIAIDVAGVVAPIQLRRYDEMSESARHFLHEPNTRVVRAGDKCIELTCNSSTPTPYEYDSRSNARLTLCC